MLAFAGSLCVVLVYALRGGSYDPVVFQEHGLVIWWTVAVALAVGLLPRARPPREVVLLLGALLAYALWIVLSLTWTASSERTTTELARTLDYAGVVAVAGLVLDRSTWRAAAAGLGLGALLVCAFALGTRLAPSVFGRDYIDSAFHTDRLSRPFGYWNAVGAWAAMSIAIGLAWSAHDTVRVRRAIALGLVPVAGAVEYLTYSRGGIGGTAVGVIAVLLLSRNRLTTVIHLAVAGAATAIAIAAIRGAPEIAHATGTGGASGVFVAVVGGALICAGAALCTAFLRADRWRLPRPLVRPLGALLALVLVVAAAAVGPHLARRAWHSFTRTTPVASTAPSSPTARLSTLSGSRYAVWKVTIKAFDAHPATGTGAGTFEFWWDRHATTREFVVNAHNLWLQNMAELGLPGLLLITAAAVAALAAGGSARRRARRATSAGATAGLLAAFIVYLLQASIDWMWESTAVTVLALAAVTIAAARGSFRPLRLRLPLRALAAGAAVAAGLLQWPGITSTDALRRSQSAERVGNASLALAWARNAVGAEPWSASAYEQRGLVLEAAGRLAGAAEDLHSAISHEPTNFRHWLILARIETERGRLSAAVADYNQAHRLRPLGTVFALAPYFGTQPP